MDFKELKLDKLGFKPFDKIYRNLPIEKTSSSEPFK